MRIDCYRSARTDARFLLCDRSPVRIRKFPFDGKMSRISNVYLHVLVAIAIPGYVPDGFLQEEESDRALPDEIHLRHMTVN